MSHYKYIYVHTHTHKHTHIYISELFDGGWLGVPGVISWYTMKKFYKSHTMVTTRTGTISYEIYLNYRVHRSVFSPSGLQKKFKENKGSQTNPEKKHKVWCWLENKDCLAILNRIITQGGKLALVNRGAEPCLFLAPVFCRCLRSWSRMLHRTL